MLHDSCGSVRRANSTRGSDPGPSTRHPATSVVLPARHGLPRSGSEQVAVQPGGGQLCTGRLGDGDMGPGDGDNGLSPRELWGSARWASRSLIGLPQVSFTASGSTP